MFKQSECLIKAAARRSSLPSIRCCSSPHHHHHHQATGSRNSFRHLSSPAFQEAKESIPDDTSLKTKRKEILSGVIELNKQRKKNLTELKKNEEEITVTKEKDEKQ